MLNSKSYILPKWLDRIIFEDFRAQYEPRPSEVVYNPDQPYDFVRIYLGTYFPRSYAEAFGITSHLLSINSFLQHYIELEEINLLDFCCGTGGEIIGAIYALQSKLPNLRIVNVDAFDANPNAIRFLYHLINAVNESQEIRIRINVNPQGIFIASEQEIVNIVQLTNVKYHFMMSFKAINEFIQHKTFASNAYELIASHLFPLLNKQGVFIMTDVTTKLDNSPLYYPEVMNKGLNKYLKSSTLYKTIVPSACYTHERICPGCYMQDTYYISHSRKNQDLSKIAYRVVCKSEFADKIMNDMPLQQCRATIQQADKNLPYKYICH